MKIAQINFMNSEQITDEDAAIVQSALIPFLNRGAEFKKDSKGGYPWWQDFFVDASKLTGLVHKITLQYLSAGPEAIAGIESRPNPVINNKINVAVPGFGLLAIDEVQVLYDQCTDNLREELEQGWRVLAICPQPDQRRPDYIMGRR